MSWDEDSAEQWAAQELCERQRFESEFLPAHSGHSTEERAMKTSQMIQSKFLKKEDFPQPEVLTIKDVSIEEVGRGDTRWVLWFKEKPKGIVLNVTKIKQLESAYGDESDNWNGKKVKVMHDPSVMMGTERVGGIKFVFPSGQHATPPPPPKAALAGGDGFDDEDVGF